MLVNSRSCLITDNVVSSTNLGIFVRGAKSTGNRIAKNVVTGGAIAGRNLLGICYNPAATPAGGTADPAGPRGDSIYNNTIARYGWAIAVSDGTISNVFTENVLSSFNGAFREPANFTAGGGTNVELDNTAVTIPASDL
jgi:parallel beta-helix repeat protein